jgi:hypothetical protein
MSETSKTLFVPLGSNAQALVDGGAGETVESIRRRLKFASIAFDAIWLESGILNVNAGPGGSSAIRQHDQGAEFQTEEQRKVRQTGGFAISLGTEG